MACGVSGDGGRGGEELPGSVLVTGADELGPWMLWRYGEDAGEQEAQRPQGVDAPQGQRLYEAEDGVFAVGHPRAAQECGE